MKRYIQLVFILLILLNNIETLKPKEDPYELPIISAKRNKTSNTNRPQSKPYIPNTSNKKNPSLNKGKLVSYSKRENNYRYFIYDTSSLKQFNNDHQNNLLYFKVSSPEMNKTNIKYQFSTLPIASLNLNNLSKNFFGYWFTPLSIIKTPNKKSPKQYDYYMAINYFQPKKDSLIIKVISPNKTDDITCTQISESITPIKGQMSIDDSNKKNKLHHNHNHDKHRPDRDPSKPNKDYKEHRGGHRHQRNYTDYKYRDFNKKMRHKFKKVFKHNSFGTFIAIILGILWQILLVLYCLVNRRKKSFSILLKNSEMVNNLSNYRNI